MKEEWRPVPGYENYSVSNTGRVIRAIGGQGAQAGRELEQHPNEKGYLWVRLTKNNRPKSFFVHKLVLLAFSGPMPDGMTEINHENGNKGNNRLDNLEYSTRSGNIQHAYDTGLKPSMKGVRNGSAVLDDEKVREIRKLYSEGGWTHRALSLKFSVGKATITRILSGGYWGHV
jgi:hypothetical protein